MIDNAKIWEFVKRLQRSGKREDVNIGAQMEKLLISLDSAEDRLKRLEMQRHALDAKKAKASWERIAACQLIK